MKYSVLIMALMAAVVVNGAWADTANAQKLADKYAATAKLDNPKWVGPTAEEGKAFFSREVIQFKGDRNNPGKPLACASCHTANPADAGKHVVTGKKIAPLSPVVNPKRFKDLAKVDKSFTKHCNEVVGSDCSAGEKASFITYLLTETTPTKP